MIARRTILAGGIALAIPSFAAAISVDNPATFEGTFQRDESGGKYTYGIDQTASSRFCNNASGLVAEYQIRKAHRTIKFSSGVAFWIVDSTSTQIVRIAFDDRRGQRYVIINAQLFLLNAPPEKRPVQRDLFSGPVSTTRGAVGRVLLRSDSAGHIVVQVDDKSYEVHAGFRPDRLLVQIFCAEAWVTFPNLRRRAELQKKRRCSQPSRRAPTWCEAAAAGAGCSRGSIPNGWSSSMRPG